jgi:mutator protein MutT
MIEVVSAVITHRGRVLLTQRREDKDFPLHWECPGGKVDGDESHHDALRRELLEEIGVQVRGISEDATWCGEFRNMVQRAGRAHVFVLFYPVALLDGHRPAACEGQPGIGWFTAEEMRGLTLAPANVEARDAISRRLAVSWNEAQT